MKEMFIGVESVSPALIAVVFGPSRLSSSKKADRFVRKPVLATPQTPPFLKGPSDLALCAPHLH